MHWFQRQLSDNLEEKVILFVSSLLFQMHRLQRKARFQAGLNKSQVFLTNEKQIMAKEVQLPCLYWLRRKCLGNWVTIAVEAGLPCLRKFQHLR